MRELALFAGAGGGILGGHLLGWRTVCAVEIAPYCRSVLLARQRDGMLPRFPVWDDVRTFDGRPWRGHVDVVSGGFPCQDISVAGRGRGLNGERSGLWREMARVVREVGPRHVFVENSPALVTRGIHVVLSDLAALGYDARWGVLGADDAGAPHKRKRIWIIATDAQRVQVREQSRRVTGARREGEGVAGYHGGKGVVAHTNRARRAQQQQQQQPAAPEQPAAQRSGWWSAEPDVGRVADGVASRVDRLAALGNGQVPAVARLAWGVLNA